MRITNKLTTLPKSLTGLIHAPNAATSNAQLVREYDETGQGVNDAARDLLIALLKHRRSTLRLGMRMEQVRAGKAPALTMSQQRFPQLVNFQVTNLLRTLLNHTVAFMTSTNQPMALLTRDKDTTQLVRSVRKIGHQLQSQGE